MDIRGGETGGRLGAPFFRDVAGRLFKTFALSFCIVFLKADEPLQRKSYVFQNKAKIYVKRGPLTTLMCRQRTM